MSKRYYIFLGILGFLIVLCFIIYFFTYEACNVMANIFCNMSVGLITGFVLLIASNIKSTLLYKNNVNITKLRNIISDIREYEIKIINYGALDKISKYELLNTYVDLSNIVERIYEVDSCYFEDNNYIFKDINDNYNSCIEKYDSIGFVNRDEYDKEISEDLSNKMHIIYKLRRSLRVDLQKLELENDKLNKSIL